MYPRPKTIPIVAAFLFAATVIAVVVGASLLFPNPMMEPLWRLNPQGAKVFQSIGRVSGVFLLLLGIGTLAAGRGLLQGKKWAWWFSVALFAIEATSNAITYPLTRDVLRNASGVVIALGFLYVLVRRESRCYFGVSE